MPFVAIALDYSDGLPLIVAAGVCMYIASKGLADALAGGKADRAGRLAIGQWLPIATVTVAAAVSHRGPMAMGLVFGTSVACLSLAGGAAAFLGGVPLSGSGRRTWALLLPAALLAFLAGFRASVSLFNAGAIALEGVCILLLWNDKTEKQSEAAGEPVIVGRGVLFRCSQALLGLMLAGVGSWFAMHGVERVAAGSEFATTGLLTTTLLSPLLVLPIIGTGTELAQRNQSGVAIGSQVGVALLNTCLLFPLIVTTGAVQQMIARKTGSTDGLDGFPFPLAVWRVDVVMLIALGLFLLPVSIGKWSISKTQGAGLMFGYAVYLALSIIVGVVRV
jgi:Ca2+/Na+ antiporter